MGVYGVQVRGFFFAMLSLVNDKRVRTVLNMELKTYLHTYAPMVPYCTCMYTVVLVWCVPGVRVCLTPCTWYAGLAARLGAWVPGSRYLK